MPPRRVSARPAVVTAILAAACCAGCVHDSTVPSASLALSAASRSVSLREDSLGVRADSALVLLSSVLSGASWSATHGAAAWLTLTTTTGAGTGLLRWTRDVTALTSGTWVDTITVTVPGVPAVAARLVDSVTVRDAPSQFISVRRAWRPGERDSVAAFIVRTGALGEFSDVAAQALALEDATADVVPNPAWRPPGAPPIGVQLAPQFQAGWGARGLDFLVVFDSLPDDPAVPASLGIQRDSLDWVSVRWWNPADSTWKGWMIRGTTQSTFPGDQQVNTTAFDATGLHSGVGGGESRLASGTYWEANGGKFRVTLNGNYGPFAQIGSGGYAGGDLAVGQQGGRLNNIIMPRQLGTDTPATQLFSFDYGLAPVPSWRIVCYFAPVPPVAPFHQCTGPAAAAIVAAARAGRLDPRAVTGIRERPRTVAAPRRLSPARHGRATVPRPGPLLAQPVPRPAGGAR